MKGQKEKQIRELEQELGSCTNLKEKVDRDSMEQIKRKNDELERAKEEQTVTRNLVKKLQVEIKDIKDKQEDMVNTKDELLKTLNVKNSIISGLIFKENESKIKISEALQLVEAALIEKDAALQREINTKSITNPLYSNNTH